MQVRFSIVCSLVVLVAIALCAAAQNRVEFEFGVRAGVPFTVPLESRLTGPASTFSSQAFERPPVSVGPAFAVLVYDRLAIEFDSLYKPMRFHSSVFNGTSYSSTSGRVSSWEFPLIADYSILKGPIRPYGGGGMVLGQILSGTTESRSTFLSTGMESHIYNQFRTLTNQFPAYVTNAGVEWYTSRIVIRPELRYTRWDDTNSSLKSRLDQFGFLIGFSLR